MKHYKDSTDTIYAIEDDGSQDFLVKPDWILLTQDELTAMRAPTPEQAASQAQAVADANEKASAKADSVVTYLINHTPAECAAYVQANVTNLATARDLMAKLAMALCVLSKQGLR